MSLCVSALGAMELASIDALACAIRVPQSDQIRTIASGYQDVTCLPVKVAKIAKSG